MKRSLKAYILMLMAVGLVVAVSPVIVLKHLEAGAEWVLIGAPVMLVGCFLMALAIQCCRHKEFWPPFD